MVIRLDTIPEAADIPKNWIYHHYLKLKEPLDGRRIRIKSCFNSDSTPSMFLYVSNGEYRWKDFSSGLFGSSPYDLIQQIVYEETGERPEFKEVLADVKSQYREWVAENGEYREIELDVDNYLFETKVLYDVRSFAPHDLQYFETFYITEERLKAYNIKPLENFQLYRQYPGKDNSWINKFFKQVTSHYSYGFFNAKRQLIKIYNPYSDNLKHISLKNEILGHDQLRYQADNLIIASSMKDLLSLDSFNLDCEYIAPMSEKMIIDVEDIKFFKSMYKNVFTLFDNDKTGVQAMMLYKKLYDINFIYIPRYKDIAEFCANEPYDIVQRELIPAIDKALNK